MNSLPLIRLHACGYYRKLHRIHVTRPTTTLFEQSKPSRFFVDKVYRTCSPVFISITNMIPTNDYPLRRCWNSNGCGGTLTMKLCLMFPVRNSIRLPTTLVHVVLGVVFASHFAWIVEYENMYSLIETFSFSPIRPPPPLCCAYIVVYLCLIASKHFIGQFVASELLYFNSFRGLRGVSLLIRSSFITRTAHTYGVHQ